MSVLMNTMHQRPKLVVLSSVPNGLGRLTGLRATFARLAAERLGSPPEAAAPKAAAPAGSAPAAVSVAEGCIERRVPVSFVRQRVMKRLKETQNTVAQLSTFQEVDMTAALKLRAKYKDMFLKLHGSQLGLLDELSVADLSTSTFGIVDTGIAGSMLGTGIINYPQSASMGTNSVKRRPTVVDGKIEARPIMYTALNYDHRLIDGREAVTFLCSVRDKLEDWGDFFYCDDLIHFSTEAFSGSISNAAGSLIHWISNAAPRKRTYEIHPGSNSWS
ncbi:unnamed protein product [Durusdinium trenchii]|uniref:dihydrolipoyllysine-residue succinyltransferase n=1 Tax=Durusdinium trenchii TaxID=1381693 RepID=A0ABP0RHQ4_9DINO